MGTLKLLGFCICDKDLEEMLDERKGKESMVKILSNEETNMDMKNFKCLILFCPCKEMLPFQIHIGGLVCTEKVHCMKMSLSCGTESFSRIIFFVMESVTL